MFSRVLAFLLIAAGLAAGIDALRPPGTAALPAAIAPRITAEALPLDPAAPGRDRLGLLRFHGAVRLRSDTQAFGGVSALAAGTDGFLAVTDAGNWLDFGAVEAGDRLTGVTAVRMAPILGMDGRPAASKAAGDAEGLVRDPASDAAQVSYEQQHRIIHFAGRAPVRDERLTATMAWPANGGGEAMVQLPGGARLVFAEPLRRPDGTRLALLTQGGRTRSIGVAGVPGFSPVDAAALDARRIIVLHRRFAPTGRGSALMLVDLGAVLDGRADTAPARLLARWGPPLVHDNFEGLALRRTGGRVFLYLVSDDNFSAAQATILMKLELPAAVISPGGAPSP